MQITFIKPSMTTGIQGDALDPLAIGILAALTSPDIQRKFYDERIEPIDFGEPTDLVAISCDTYSARRTYQIANHYRQRNIPVVLGGCHPTLWTEEALPYADAVVVGDAEDTWPNVVEDARQGRLQRIYRSRNPPLDGLRLDRSIFAGKNYGPMRLVQLGRGCPHGCDFCAIHALYGTLIRSRPVDEVIAEVENLRSRSIIFTDDNLFAHKAVAIELLNRLKPLKIRWSCQATLNVADNDGLLRLMAESGCLAVTIGLESLRDDNLIQMHKGRNQSSRQYAASIQKFHNHGIMVYGSFIFGYDHDTAQDFALSLDFAIRQKLLLAMFNPLIPMPGTPLYQRLEAEGRLIYNPWWLDPAYRYGSAPFHPRGMTAEELTAGIYRTRTEFNRLGSLLRRGLNMKANMRSLYNAGAYLTVNLLNRREIHRKQGLPLGYQEPLDLLTCERERE